MTRRYYTLGEANRMVPRLEEAFYRMMQLRLLIQPIYERLDEADAAPTDEEFEPSEPGIDAWAVSDRASLKALMQTLREELDGLRSEGVLVKGIHNGLVDWYAMHQGREIFLCWKLGEREVGWWHDLHAGFAGRKPISELQGAGPGKRSK